MSLDQSLRNLKEKLNASSKEKLLCLSTTANITNPNIYFGSLRETPTTIAGNIIVRELLDVEKVIETFDGLVSYFLIDPEVKNEVPDLEAYVVMRIKKSKYLIYKPNDFTVDSLDMLIACKRGSIRDQNVYIVGLGNIGAKTALSLCERGAQIFAYERNQEKLKTTVDGLNVIKRSTSQIYPVADLYAIDGGIDILIGTTPGIAVIDAKVVDMIKADGIIIDVGNGTLTPEGIARAHERNIPIHSLSSFGGYLGMIENWLFQRAFLSRPAKKESEGIVLVTPGTLGARGEILVDDVDHPKKVIGVCNGLGDLFPKEEAMHYLETVEKTLEQKDLIHKIQKLYL